MRKEVTREDVIRAGVELNRRIKNMINYEDIAAEIADVLGLPAPKPFEAVGWAVVWQDGKYHLHEQRPESLDGRVIPVLITEIDPSDPRLAEGK